jgi:nicotinamide mononucleotide transporter
VGMFVYKGLKPTAALYSVFLVLAALGYAQWKRSYQADRLAVAPGPVPLA